MLKIYILQVKLKHLFFIIKNLQNYSIKNSQNIVTVQEHLN